MPKVWTFYGHISAPSFDGDSATIYLDQGLTDWKHDVKIRFYGCNAIERYKPGGVEARDNLRAMLPVGTKVRIDSYGYDKYGPRLDARLFLLDGQDIVTELIQAGWLVPWDGNGTPPLPAWPRVLLTAEPHA